MSAKGVNATNGMAELPGQFRSSATPPSKAPKLIGLSRSISPLREPPVDDRP
jgi:hypothetical protein